MEGCQGKLSTRMETQHRCLHGFRGTDPYPMCSRKWRAPRAGRVSSTQVAIGEVLVACKCLKEGGNFVCKMFDTFSDLSASIIYLLYILFDHLLIVKPYKSRSVNSERYLVAKSLRSRDTPIFERAVSILERAHRMCCEDEDSTPASLVPVDIMLADAKFKECLSKVNDHVAVHQTAALKVRWAAGAQPAACPGRGRRYAD